MIRAIVCGILMVVLPATAISAKAQAEQDFPAGIVPTRQPVVILEGLHKFGEPFTKRPMQYGSTGLLVNDISLNAGWGAAPIKVSAGTPVFGVVFRYQLRSAVGVANVEKPMWCGVLPVAYEQLGGGPTFCATDLSGSNTSLMSRMFDGPEGVSFPRFQQGGTPYYPVEYSRFGGSPKIVGVFDVLPQPVDLGKQLWTGMAIMRWDSSSVFVSQLFGEGQTSNALQVAIRGAPLTGRLGLSVGSETVFLEKVDDQHYRVTTAANRASVLPATIPATEQPVRPTP